MNIQEIVNDIQNKIGNKTDKDYYLQYTILGFTEAVDVVVLLHDTNVEINLWNSENDCREYLENGEYEDFEKFIKRKLKEVIDALREFKNILK